MRNTKRRKISNGQLDRQLALARHKLRLMEARIIRDGIATQAELDTMAEETEQPRLGNGSIIEWGDGLHRIESHNADEIIVVEVGRAATSTAV